MILKIKCTSCKHDMVRYSNHGVNNQLECFECGGSSFIAYHDKGEEIKKVREQIKEIKTTFKDIKTENFDDIINELGKNFENLFA